MREVMSTKVVSSVANGMANIGVGASARHEFSTASAAPITTAFTFEPVYTDHSVCASAARPIWRGMRLPTCRS